MPIFDPQSLQTALSATQTVSPVARTNPMGQGPQLQPDPPSMAGPIAALVGGNALDAGTSYHALHSNPNAYESNPVLPSSGGGIAAVKAAATLPEILLVKYLASHGHPTAAKALGYGTGALGVGLGVNNLMKSK